MAEDEWSNTQTVVISVILFLIGAPVSFGFIAGGLNALTFGSFIGIGLGLGFIFMGLIIAVGCIEIIRLWVGLIITA